MSAERSKIWEASKGVVVGVAIIALAIAGANVALLNIGLFASSGF